MNSRSCLPVLCAICTEVYYNLSVCSVHKLIFIMFCKLAINRMGFTLHALHIPLKFCELIVLSTYDFVQCSSDSLSIKRYSLVFMKNVCYKVMKFKSTIIQPLG